MEVWGRRHCRHSRNACLSTAICDREFEAPKREGDACALEISLLAFEEGETVTIARPRREIRCTSGVADYHIPRSVLYLLRTLSFGQPDRSRCGTEAAGVFCANSCDVAGDSEKVNEHLAQNDRASVFDLDSSGKADKVKLLKASRGNERLECWVGWDVRGEGAPPPMQARSPATDMAAPSPRPRARGLGRRERQPAAKDLVATILETIGTLLL